MRSLFSKSSLKILKSLSFTKTLYVFDFDGTLSKIVSAPSKAKTSLTTIKLLRQLAKVVPVAIVSGRSVEDLKQRLDFHPAYFVGNHGLEGLRDHRSSLKKAEKACKAWKESLAKIRFSAGTELEDKTYSLAIHFRDAPQKKEARIQIAQAIALLTPAVRVIPGKSVVNLLPVAAPHKGMAVLSLMAKVGAKSAFYIGDDDTDEDVFSIPNKQIMSVRVGRKKNSHASYFMERQSQINEVLRLLIRYHSPEKKQKLNRL